MKEAQLLSADLIRDARYGTDGYFWTDTYDGDNVVLLGNAEVEGKNRFNNVDANGFPFIKEIIQAGRSGGGYTDYWFPRSTGGDALPKRGYSLAFEPFQWVIGTGNYTEFIDEAIAEQRAVVEQQISRSIMQMTTIAVISLVIAIMLSLYITMSIVRPLGKFVRTTDRLAKGDFDTEIDVRSKDELGTLANSLSLLVERLKTYGGYINEISDQLESIGKGDLRLNLVHDYDGEFRPIKDALERTSAMLSDTLAESRRVAGQVSIGSEQVSRGAQALSQGAAEQASAIEELSASISDIAGHMKDSGKGSEEARELTRLSNENVAQSQSQMQEMLRAMENISSKSNEIGKIVQNIDSIAFQTNILALNAAVEAARAGEAGKGFAVVADEVRNLAGKSAESAKITTELIDATIEAIRRGTLIASETAESLEGVVDKSQKISDIIEKIASASADQARAIDQINIGFEQISSVVQANSATSEESAAASEELSGQAQLLEDLTGRFQLANNSDALQMKKAY